MFVLLKSSYNSHYLENKVPSQVDQKNPFFFFSSYMFFWKHISLLPSYRNDDHLEKRRQVLPTSWGSTEALHFPYLWLGSSSFGSTALRSLHPLERSCHAGAMLSAKIHRMVSILLILGWPHCRERASDESSNPTAVAPDGVCQVKPYTLWITGEKQNW